MESPYGPRIDDKPPVILNLSVKKRIEKNMKKNQHEKLNESNTFNVSRNLGNLSTQSSFTASKNKKVMLPKSIIKKTFLKIPKNNN